MSSGTEECGDDRFPKSDSEDGPRAMVIPGRGPSLCRVDLAADGCVARALVEPSLGPFQLFLFPRDILFFYDFYL